MESHPLSFRGELPLADKNDCLGFGQNLLRFNLFVVLHVCISHGNFLYKVLMPLDNDMLQKMPQELSSPK